MKTTYIMPKTDIIIRERILQGKTLADVAAAGNVPPASVSRVERGGSASAPTAAGICTALGKEFDDLFEIQRPGGTDNPPAGKEVE